MNFDFNRVELVSYSQPCSTMLTVTEPYDTGNGNIGESLREMTLAEQIEYMARVSNPASQAAQQEGQQEVGRLTQYLTKNNHWSPLEMASATMLIGTTRDIARQILRHRSFSFQEFSTRYAEVPVEDFVVKQARSQDLQNRQNSIDNMSQEDKDWWEIVQGHHATDSADRYREALKRGIAKEVARTLLPEGMTPSVLFMAGTIRSWKHYIDSRSANGTQLEHQDIALKAKAQLGNAVPSIFGD